MFISSLFAPYLQHLQEILVFNATNGELYHKWNLALFWEWAASLFVFSANWVNPYIYFFYVCKLSSKRFYTNQWYQHIHFWQICQLHNQDLNCILHIFLFATLAWWKFLFLVLMGVFSSPSLGLQVKHFCLFVVAFFFFPNLIGLHNQFLFILK